MDTGISAEDQQKIIGVLRVLFSDARIYLYGSRARGTQSSFSDIDLAIDMGEKIPLYAISEARAMLNESNLPFKIDMVDMHRIPEKMQKFIQKEGIEWI